MSPLVQGMIGACLAQTTKRRLAQHKDFYLYDSVQCQLSILSLEFQRGNGSLQTLRSRFTPRAEESAGAVVPARCETPVCRSLHVHREWLTNLQSMETFSTPSRFLVPAPGSFFVAPVCAPPLSAGSSSKLQVSILARTQLPACRFGAIAPSDLIPVCNGTGSSAMSSILTPVLYLYSDHSSTYLN